MKKDYKYDAFISYRHVEPDQTIAARLHTMLETFTLPKNLQADSENRKFRVFRDREELSAADLSDSIQDALRHSANLIVICTRQTPLSPWCAKEIETFRRFHGDSHIIAVLAEGEPEESFPASLLDLKKELTLEDGTTEFVQRELLAAELRPEEVLKEDFPGYAKLLAEQSPRVSALAKKSTALLKTEIYRIVAGMLGVSFGDLKQRDKERRLRRTLQLVTAGAVTMLVFGVIMLNLYWRADAAELQSTQQSSLMTMTRAAEHVRNGNRMTGALIGKEAMAAAREQMPAYERLSAQYEGILNDALYTDAFETTSVLDTGNTSPFFSAAGNQGRILTSGDQNLAYIWDLATGETLLTLEHPMPVFSLALSDDGNLAYTGALDGNLYEWDARTGENLRVIPLTSGAADIRPTADQRTMVVARLDGGLDLWDIETGEMQNLDLGDNRRVFRATIHPGGKRLVVSLRSSDSSLSIGEVLEWDMETGKKVRAYDLGPNPGTFEYNSIPKFSPNGAVLVLTTPTGSMAIREDGKEVRIEDPNLSGMTDYAVSYDGSLLYVPENRIQEAGLQAWDLRSGRQVKSYLGRSGSIDRVAVSADRKIVAASWHDHGITVWNTETGGFLSEETPREITGHTGRISGLAFTEDSAYLLSGSMDGTVRVTPTRGQDTGEIIDGILAGVSDNQEHVLFKKSDGLQDSYFLWSWEREPTPVQGLEDANVLSSFYVSNHGGILTYSRTGFANAALVDARTGKHLRNTDAHGLHAGSINPLADLSFSPDDSQVATLGEDGVIKRIQVDTGRVLKEITGIPSGAHTLRWSTDGERLMVVTLSGKTLVYTTKGVQTEEVDGVLYNLYPTEGGYGGMGLQGDELFTWDEKDGIRSIALTRDRRGIADRQFNLDRISPDRKTMLSVVQNQVVLTDVKTGERLRTLETSGNIERNGAIHPDGTRLIYTYGKDTSKIITLYDREALQETLTRRLGHRSLNEKELEEIGR